MCIKDVLKNFKRFLRESVNIWVLMYVLHMIFEKVYNYEDNPTIYSKETPPSC